MDGWIKLHRSVLERGWLTNHKLWAFWSYCLLKASYKETVVLVNTQQVHLHPGEFVFGRKRAATDLNMTEKSIRTFVETLVRLGNIQASRRASTFTVYSIVNWATYQSEETDEGQQEGVEKGQQEGTIRAGKGPHTRSKEEKNKENTLVISPANNPCPHREIISLYHDTLPMLPRVRTWTPKRQKMLKARWFSDPEYQDLGWWKDFFAFVKDSCPHLTGKNDRNWTADLEWLVKEANFVKTIEGRYEKK